jgi:hypothetical protein
MPFSERIATMTRAARADAIDYLHALKIHMTPADPKDMAEVIDGLFAAYDVAPPSARALDFWFQALGPYPLWAIEKACGELILEQSFKPQIADVMKRLNPMVAPFSTVQKVVRHLLDYAPVPDEPFEPVSEERKAEVARLLAANGLGLKMEG